MTLFPDRLDRTGFITKSALLFAVLLCLSLMVQQLFEMQADLIITLLTLMMVFPLILLVRARLKDFAPRFPLYLALALSALIYIFVSLSGLVPLEAVSWVAHGLGILANIIMLGGFIALCTLPTKTSQDH